MRKISRRSFARTAMVYATAAAVVPYALAQSEPAAPKPADAAPKPPENPPALSSASWAEIDARVAWITKKYGAHLDEAQRADIRRLITGGQAGLEALRAYPLDNGAQPADTFRVVSGRVRAAGTARAPRSQSQQHPQRRRGSR